MTQPSTPLQIIRVLALVVALPAAAVAQHRQEFSPAPNPEEAGFSSTRLERIDDMIEALIASEEVPGAVVFIARDGRVALHRAYGVRDAETRIPLRRGA